MAIQGAFTLNPNEIFASLANMIISQEVFADNLGKHQTLVDKARVDGGLYGDKKPYYASWNPTLGEPTPKRPTCSLWTVLKIRKSSPSL